jgi:ABC-type oligopeptide transport system substrate-binding subunit
MVKYLQAAWLENLGVEILWRQFDWSSFLDWIDGEVPSIWIMGWIADYPDPDNFLRAASWRPWTGWSNEVYDGLADDALRRVMDQEKRVTMCREAETILVDETPILPLTYGRHHMLIKPWVRGLRISPMGEIYYEDIIIEPH